MSGKKVRVLRVVGIGTGIGVAVLGLLFWINQNSAHARLVQVRKELRADGLPLTASEMHITFPPVEENAAPIYVQLMQLLKAKPVTGKDDILNDGDSNFYPTPESLAQGRAAVHNRQDILQLVHQVAGRPKCVFNRDYSLGPNLLLPEYAYCRTGVRALMSESAVLVADGKPVEAVHNMALGFQMAHHLDTEPILIGQLVAIAIDAITLRGLEDILDIAGDRPGVADAVADAVARNWKPTNMAHAMEGEVVMSEVVCNMIRRDPAGMAGVMSSMGSQTPAEAQAQASLLRVIGPFFTATLLDSNEANVLDYEHRAFQALKRPYRQGQEDLAVISKSLEANEKKPSYILAGILLPVYNQATTKQAQDETRALTTRSAALVLAYRARHGRFPERLEEAVSPVPIDPLNGQPLQYRLYRVSNAANGSKGFEIYSAGTDGKFDGGIPTEKPKEYQTTFWYPMAPYQREIIAKRIAPRYSKTATKKEK